MLDDEYVFFDLGVDIEARVLSVLKLPVVCDVASLAAILYNKLPLLGYLPR
jgi:hypothetical protein